MELVRQRCFHHANREAAARCPGCRRYFCRECITEHDGRVLCASCVAREAAPEQRRHSRLGLCLEAAGCLFLLLLLWAGFHLLGQGLLRLPDTFHDPDRLPATAEDAP